jgi:TRAP-type C4-dicarboxylate transport system permease small subunit
MPWLRIATKIERVLDVVSAVCLAIMVSCLAIQIFGRYFFHWTPNWSEEVARFLMVWMTMLASAAALRSGGHIAVTALLNAVPPRVQFVLMLVRDAAILATLGLLAWTGWQFAAMNVDQESPAMDVSMAIPYTALTVGALLMAVQLALSRLARTPIPASDGIDGSV